MKRLLALLFAFALSACAATGPLFVEAPLPANGDAIIYVYRMPNLGAAAQDAHIHLDGRHVFDLNIDGYSYVAVPAGKHELRQEWDYWVAWGKAVKLPLTVNAGETRFVRFEVDMGAIGSHIDMGWKLAEVPAHIARQEIADKHFQEPEAAPAAEASASSR